MFGDIFEGAVRFGASYIGGKERLERQRTAEAAYEQSMQDYFSQDTSNLYANMQNTMEDLTVNTQAAEFAAQQQQQGLANVMNQARGAAGGSGIAALAQSLAQQQSQNMLKASASIGQQEQANAMAAAKQAGINQMAELKGAEQSRALQSQLLGEQFQIDAYEKAAADKAIQDARQARMDAIGQVAGGVGNVVGGMTFGDFSSLLGNTEVELPSKEIPKVSTTSESTPGLKLRPIFR